MVVCTTTPMIRMATAATCPSSLISALSSLSINPYNIAPARGGAVCSLRTVPCAPTNTPTGYLPPACSPPPPHTEAPVILVPYNFVYAPAAPSAKQQQCPVPSCGGVLQCCQLAPAVLPPPPVEVCPVVPAQQQQVVPATEYSLQPNLCSVTAAPSWKQSYGMEQVWQSEFTTLFRHYHPHNWMLLPIIQKPIGIWNSNVDSAKVRFCCEDCGHGWTSMKGRVAFWFVLNPSNGEGVVCLKLYGQQCDRCKTGNYEPAMWYPEEVLKVLVNIYNRVGQVYYGFQQAPYHRLRRAGKPRTPHNSDLCQACKDGVCAERR